MKTLDVDSLTNSVVMAISKELAKNDISIYEVDPSEMTRKLMRGMVAGWVADKHFALAQAAMAEAERQTKAAQTHLKQGTALRAQKAA